MLNTFLVFGDMNSACVCVCECVCMSMSVCVCVSLTCAGISEL